MGNAPVAMESEREESLLLRLAIRHGHLVQLLHDGKYDIKTGLFDCAEPADPQDGVYRVETPEEAADLAQSGWLSYPRADAVSLIREAVNAGAFATVLARGGTVHRVVIQPTRKAWARRLRQSAWSEIVGAFN